MYTLRVEASFSSAHNLRRYKGKCEELHGHNWRVEITAEGETLGGSGMLIDFTELKAALRAELEKLDHKYLNAVPYFKKVNPTSENIAAYLYARLKRAVPAIASVTVWENPTSAATYSERRT